MRIRATPYQHAPNSGGVTIIRHKGLLAALFVLSLVGVAAFLGMHVFALARIDVQGCVLRDPDEVRALSGLMIGDSVFKISNAQVREGIESSPYYELESVALELPDAIRLTVRERQPRAVINYLSANIVMDEHGAILDVRQEVGNVRCPLVTGMRVTSFRVGEVVESSDAEQVAAMNAILTELVRQDCFNTVSQIDVLDTLDLRLILMDGVTVRLGTLNEMEGKITWMRAASAEINARALGRGDLDVSSGKLATFRTEAARAADEDENGLGSGAQTPGDGGDEGALEDTDAPQYDEDGQISGEEDANAEDENQ